MPSADQVPIKLPHLTMLRPKWVVLIAGSTGFLVSLALDHHGPDHSRDLVGERYCGNLRRPPRQQGREPGPMFDAMDLGVTDDRKRAGHE